MESFISPHLQKPSTSKYERVLQENHGRDERNEETESKTQADVPLHAAEAGMRLEVKAFESVDREYWVQPSLVIPNGCTSKWSGDIAAQANNITIDHRPNIWGGALSRGASVSNV